MLTPNTNRGMTCQTDEKHLTILPEYFVGVVKLAINCYNNHFLLCVFTNNSSQIFIKCDIEKTLKMSRLSLSSF